MPDIKTFFVNSGIPFPEGTSLAYQGTIGLLTVTNTRENIERLEAMLDLLEDCPVQIEVEASFIKIEKDKLKASGLDFLVSVWGRMPEKSGMATTRVLTPEDMNRVRQALEKGDAELMAAPKVITKNGQNAEVKAVRELIYPTEFEQQAQAVETCDEEEARDNAMSQIVVTPGGFQTRDLGMVLNVTPTVMQDGRTIDLVLLPQVVELAGWVSYDVIPAYTCAPESAGINKAVRATQAAGRPVPPDSTEALGTMKQPVFRSLSVATSVSIRDGQTVIVGGACDAEPFAAKEDPLFGRAPSHNVYLVAVTVHLVSLAKAPTAPAAP